MRSISVLGSTGSIGRQTLEVADHMGVRAAALTANTDVALMERQARKYRPQIAVMFDTQAAADLKIRLADTQVRVLSGAEGLNEAAALEGADAVVTAVVGMIGLLPTLSAVRAGKRIALANKETLVCAGELVMDEAEKYGAEIIPVDSEHSAIFQCLDGKRDGVKRLILTASGGPFYGYDKKCLETVSRRQALKHPNWSMGAKITVDSATLMNKGLELIEAMRLYRVSARQVSVLVHRQSIVHSMVEFLDNSVLAQLGCPDMRLPIQYALTYPERIPGPAPALDFTKCGPLTFEQPDEETFECLSLARHAAQSGGAACVILNGANEAAVGLFLEEKIGFSDIGRLVRGALERIEPAPCSGVDGILETDARARRWVMENYN